MRRNLGTIALFFGAFLVALAVLSRFYAYDRLAVVPFNNTATTISETKPGADAEYLDIKKLEVVSGPLKSTRVTTGDVKRSKAVSNALGRDVAIWDTYSCTDKPDFDCGADETPLSGTIDLVAFDRTSGVAVEWEGATSVSGGEVTDLVDVLRRLRRLPLGATGEEVDEEVVRQGVGAVGHVRSSKR